jgi:tetratricopeptide (TPR) repeat protein
MLGIPHLSHRVLLGGGEASMIGRLRQRLQQAGRRPRAVAFLLILMALVGLAAYLVGPHLARHYQYRAVQEALDRRDFAAARARLAQCLQSWPQNAALRLLAARAARREGDYAAAEKHLGLCRQLGEDGDAIDLESAMLIAQRDDPARVEGYLLSRLGEPHSEATLILEALAQGYLKTQRLPEALSCLDRWLEFQADDVQALLWRGQILERWNNLTEAVASYRRAVAADPHHATGRRLLALALARCDRATEAVEQLERLRRQSTDAEVLLGLARCRRSLGQVDEARRLLDEILAQPGPHAEALSERGKLAFQSGQPVEAEGWLRRALGQAPFERETNYTLYLCLLQQGRKTEAARALETVERIRADLQTVSELRRKVAASPRDPSLRCQVGMIFLRNGQTQEGLRWLHSALQLAPDHAEARQALARYTRQSQK